MPSPGGGVRGWRGEGGGGGWCFDAFPRWWGEGLERRRGEGGRRAEER